MKVGAGPLVMDQVPSPLANATGIDPQPGSWRTNAISVRPLPLKSPATTRTPDVFAHDPMKVGAGPLVMDQVPSPLANATGIDPQPGSWRTNAISLPRTPASITLNVSALVAVPPAVETVRLTCRVVTFCASSPAGTLTL